MSNSITQIKDKTISLANSSIQTVAPLVQAIRHKENPFLIISGGGMIGWSLFSLLLARRFRKSMEQNLDTLQVKPNAESRISLGKLEKLVQIGSTSTALIGISLLSQGGILPVDFTFEWEQWQALETRWLRIIWLWLASVLALEDGSWKDVTSARPWLGGVAFWLTMGLIQRQRSI